MNKSGKKFTKNPPAKNIIPAKKKKGLFSPLAAHIDNKWTRGITIALLSIGSIIVIHFFYSVFTLTSNFPWLDDYDAVLQYLISFHAKSVSEKIASLFLQHNEHRIAFSRSIVLLQYYLFDKVNFKVLTIIGNSALLLIAFVLFKSVTFKKKINLLFFLPAILLLFNFRYFETIFWAMASIGNFWVLLFAFTALYFLFREEKYSIYIASFFAIAATYTSGNGLMTFIAGAFVFILTGKTFSYKNIFWSACGAVSISVYFYHYIKPPDHPPVFETLKQIPFDVFTYFLVFLGNFFYDKFNVTLTAGIVVLLFVIYISFKKYYKRSATIYSFIIFLMLTATAATLTRAGFGIEQAFAPRYIINTSLMAACCYLIYIYVNYEKIKVISFVILLLVAGFVHFDSYRFLQSRMSVKKDFDKSYELYTTGRFAVFRYGWGMQDLSRPKRILREADSLGIFKFNCQNDDSIWAKVYDLPNRSDLPHTYQVEHAEEGNDQKMHISGWALLRNINSDSTVVTIYLLDANNKFVSYVMTDGADNKTPNEKFNGDHTDYTSSGFKCSFPMNTFPPGKYRIGLQITDSKRKVETDTDSWFEL